MWLILSPQCTPYTPYCPHGSRSKFCSPLHHAPGTQRNSNNPELSQNPWYSAAESWIWRSECSLCTMEPISKSRERSRQSCEACRLVCPSLISMSMCLTDPCDCSRKKSKIVAERRLNVPQSGLYAHFMNVSVFHAPIFQESTQKPLAPCGRLPSRMSHHRHQSLLFAGGKTYNPSVGT